MRVLVTGASGFVGTHVSRALTESWHEVVTDTEMHGAGLDLANHGVAHDLVGASAPDAVIHLAARVDGRDDRWDGMLRNNQLATLRLLEALRDRARAARVIIASSSAVYGAVPRERNPIRETEPTRPVTLYGASKVATEAVASVFAAGGTRITLCRPFNTIGPGGDKRSALAQWARRLLELEDVSSDGVFHCGPLNTFRDLTDVRDIARAYASLVDHEVSEPVVNLCSGRAVEGAVVLDLLCETLGMRPRIEAAPARTDDIAFQSGDHSRVTALTGWEPCITLEQTVQDVVREQRKSASVSP